MQKLLCCLFLLILSHHVFSQQNYPVPSEQKNLLFFIQHNQGKNTFVYSLNYDKQKGVNQQEPIKITRQLFDKGAEIRPLTSIQKKFAYGLSSDKILNQQIKFEIVSLPKQKFTLDLQDPDRPRVITTVNGKQLELHRIFLMLKEGTSGLNTKVDYILFYGTVNKKFTVQKLVP